MILKRVIKEHGESLSPVVLGMLTHSKPFILDTSVISGVNEELKKLQSSIRRIELPFDQIWVEGEKGETLTLVNNVLHIAGIQLSKSGANDFKGSLFLWREYAPGRYSSLVFGIQLENGAVKKAAPENIPPKMRSGWGEVLKD